MGERNWSGPLEWVAQPYYAKLRCGNVGNLKNRNPPWDVLDGMIPLTSLRRISHIGPFPEHDSLRACISRGAEAYKMCLRSHFIMWHVSVHSEGYFLKYKFFDHAKAGSATQTEDIDEKRTHFYKCHLNPERDYCVFGDNFLSSYLTEKAQNFTYLAVMYCS